MERYAIVWKDGLTIKAAHLLPEELKDGNVNAWQLLRGEYSVVRYGKLVPYNRKHFNSEIDMMVFVFQKVITEHMMKKLYNLGDGCCSKKVIMDNIKEYREKLVELLRTRCSSDYFSMRIFEKDSKFLYKEIK